MGGLSLDSETKTKVIFDNIIAKVSSVDDVKIFSQVGTDLFTLVIYGQDVNTNERRCFQVVSLTSGEIDRVRDLLVEWASDSVAELPVGRHEGEIAKAVQRNVLTHLGTLDVYIGLILKPFRPSYIIDDINFCFTLLPGMVVLFVNDDICKSRSVAIESNSIGVVGDQTSSKLCTLHGIPAFGSDKPNVQLLPDRLRIWMKENAVVQIVQLSDDDESAKTEKSVVEKEANAELAPVVNLKDIRRGAKKEESN
jgi:hypothetical protein